jgi:hypothetical protein
MRSSVQQPISKDKNAMARARKYYLKKQLFDLEVKGQGPTKVILKDGVFCVNYVSPSNEGRHIVLV